MVELRVLDPQINTLPGVRTVHWFADLNDGSINISLYMLLKKCCFTNTRKTSLGTRCTCVLYIYKFANEFGKIRWNTGKTRYLDMVGIRMLCPYNRASNWKFILFKHKNHYLTHIVKPRYILTVEHGLWLFCFFPTLLESHCSVQFRSTCNIYIYIESRLCLLKDLRYRLKKYSSAIWSQLVLLYRNANNYKCIYVRISGDKKGHAYTTLSFSRY